jgi:hypothetical protein
VRVVEARFALGAAVSVAFRVLTMGSEDALGLVREPRPSVD